MIEFTDDDQRQLYDLNRRKGQAAWQRREAIRTARLGRLSPLTAIFTADAVDPFIMVTGEQSATLADSDPDVSQMLANISTVMGFSGRSIVELLEHLAVPEVEPTAVMRAAPADQPPAK